MASEQLVKAPTPREGSGACSGSSAPWGPFQVTYPPTSGHQRGLRFRHNVRLHETLSTYAASALRARSERQALAAAGLNVAPAAQTLRELNLLVDGTLEVLSYWAEGGQGYVQVRSGMLPSMAHVSSSSAVACQPCAFLRCSLGTGSFVRLLNGLSAACSA